MRARMSHSVISHCSMGSPQWRTQPLLLWCWWREGRGGGTYRKRRRSERKEEEKRREGEGIRAEGARLLPSSRGQQATMAPGWEAQQTNQSTRYAKQTRVVAEGMRPKSSIIIYSAWENDNGLLCRFLSPNNQIVELDSVHWMEAKWILK